MSDYKNLRGRKVRFLTSDLTMSTATEGELFYSNTSAKFKVGINLVAWAAGGDMASQHYALGSAGTQTAMLGAGGYKPASPAPGTLAHSEEYDGTTWTEGNNIGTARYNMSGSGTQTAGLIASGVKGLAPASHTPSADTEECDGTSWSEQNNTGTVHQWGTAAGTQTATLLATGINPSAVTTNCENYDGTSWTEGPNVNTGRYEVFGFGTSTAMAIAGGTTPGLVAIVEEFDGSSWTEVTNLPAVRTSAGGSGILTSGIVYGGANTTVKLDTALTYDGTNWAASPDMAAASAHGNRGSTESNNSQAIYFGRSPGSYIDKTEEWTNAATVRTVDTS